MVGIPRVSNRLPASRPGPEVRLVESVPWSSRSSAHQKKKTSAWRAIDACGSGDRQPLVHPVVLAGMCRKTATLSRSFKAMLLTAAASSRRENPTVRAAAPCGGAGLLAILVASRAYARKEHSFSRWAKRRRQAEGRAPRSVRDRRGRARREQHAVRVRAPGPLRAARSCSVDEVDTSASLFGKTPPRAAGDHRDDRGHRAGRRR